MVRLDVFNTSASQKIPFKKSSKPLFETVNLILSEMTCYIFNTSGRKYFLIWNPHLQFKRRVSARTRWFSADSETRWVTAL